ncbi:MAG: excinuclease ABC subunit UvrB [Candidatus Lokiarchaeota archaeon]|nr:excinuclease ABC subunit UvrB [Candidatus Lokiarchaeota archaeon]
MDEFRVKSDYMPKGDQPTAIQDIVNALNRRDKYITLLGATGTGKTFSIAKVIEKVQRPTIVMAPNKTLAAQLYQELKELFPDNAVEYFISYYDYYQPEAYVPEKGLYIEKDLDINEQIRWYRLKAMSSLLTRRDVIVIASVSCIFASGDPNFRKESIIKIKKGQTLSIRDLSQKLVKISYARNDIEIRPGLFRVKGDTVIIYSAEMNLGYKLFYFGDEVEDIHEVNPYTGKTIRNVNEIFLFPASEYVTNFEVLEAIIRQIREDLNDEVEEFKKQGKYAEAQRLEQRTNYDLETILEFGTCKGIENYSRYFDGRKIGERPYTLLDYFPDDYLMVMDESHIGVPQVHGMIGGDISRKKNLIDFGFRLKAAYDNRPLKFIEWDNKINQIIFTSATPGDWELERSKLIADQVIRPTGLVDPQTEIRPTEDQIEDLLNEIRQVVQRNERVLVTTLTKRLAENIAEYYAERGIKIKYLHSDIDTVERSEILRKLRSGEIEVVVGINLLREGLDLPEVSLVAILDADREGFLRNTRSLIQTIGRASRNVNGKAILYADKITKSITEAIAETNRRRAKQIRYNREHDITPQTIQKQLRESLSREVIDEEEAESTLKKTIEERIEEEANKIDLLNELDSLMREYADNLEFEKAAFLRDKIKELAQSIK